MSLFERLEGRRLFSTLAPELGRADDGKLSGPNRRPSRRADRRHSLTIAKLAHISVTVLVKFDVDSALDKRFGRRGLLEVGTNVTAQFSVGDLLADPSGRFYLKTPKTVVRLAANRSVEQSYGITKRGTALLDASGRLVVARPTAYGATVSRYTDAGTLDGGTGHDRYWRENVHDTLVDVEAEGKD